MTNPTPAAAGTTKKGNASMNEVQLAETALRLFQKFGPSIFSAFEGLINVFRGKSATTDTGTSLTTALADLHNVAETHGADSPQVKELVASHA